MYRFHVSKRFPPRRQRPRDRPGQPRRPARGHTPGACPPRARCSPPAPPTHGEPPPPPTPGGPAGPTLHRWAGYRFYTWFKYHLLSQIFCTSLENIFNVEHRTLLSSIFFNKYFWFNKYFFHSWVKGTGILTITRPRSTSGRRPSGCRASPARPRPARAAPGRAPAGDCIYNNYTYILVDISKSRYISLSLYLYIYMITMQV